jgi:hypothetical protein
MTASIPSDVDGEALKQSMKEKLLAISSRLVSFT